MSRAAAYVAKELPNDGKTINEILVLSWAFVSSTAPQLVAIGFGVRNRSSQADSCEKRQGIGSLHHDFDCLDAVKRKKSQTSDRSRN